MGQTAPHRPGAIAGCGWRKRGSANRGAAQHSRALCASILRISGGRQGELGGPILGFGRSRQIAALQAPDAISVAQALDHAGWKKASLHASLAERGNRRLKRCAGAQHSADSHQPSIRDIVVWAGGREHQNFCLVASIFTSFIIAQLIPSWPISELITWKNRLPQSSLAILSARQPLLDIPLSHMAGHDGSGGAIVGSVGAAGSG